MGLHVWTDFTTAGWSNFDCNNEPCCIRCVDLGHVALPLYFCSATLFLWFEVRACCDSAVDFTCTKVFPSLWSLKSKSPGISTWLSEESALLGVFVDFLVARGELPPPRYSCWRMLAWPRGFKLSFRTCCSNSVSFHFTQTFPRKVLVVSNHALLKSLVHRTGTEPSGRPTACTIVDRWWIRKC